MRPGHIYTKTLLYLGLKDVCSSTWDFWAGSTPALKASAATKLFCLGTKLLYISLSVSDFHETEYEILAGFGLVDSMY